MSGPALHPMPRPGEVVREQLRAVGLAIRREALVVTLLAMVAASVLVREIVAEGDVIHFHPRSWLVHGLLGALLPFVVWKGERRFGESLLWTLPVERRHHALTKALAGWMWLMLATAGFVLLLLALALLSGGNVTQPETLRILPSAAVPMPGHHVDAALVRVVRWTPAPLLWLVPFTAATATYLLTSALLLGLRNPVRWIGGFVFALVLLAGLTGLTDVPWLRFLPSRLVSSLLHGSHGLAMLLTASTEFLAARVPLSTGDVVATVPGVPDVGGWAVTSLLWIGAGVAALWAAAHRHRG